MHYFLEYVETNFAFPRDVDPCLRFRIMALRFCFADIPAAFAAGTHLGYLRFPDPRSFLPADAPHGG
jgi:hypothetical protein